MFSHLHNLTVTTDWMILDLKEKQEETVNLIKKIAEDNAKMLEEMKELRQKVAGIEKEMGELEAKNDIKAEVLLEDVNFSMASMVDIVDRVGKEAEARDRDAFFAERVKKAKLELDSGLASPVHTSTPTKFKVMGRGSTKE